MAFQVSQFDDEKGKWASYTIRIAAYFKRNAITDDAKGSAILV